MGVTHGPPTLLFSSQEGDSDEEVQADLVVWGEDQVFEEMGKQVAETCGMMGLSTSQAKVLLRRHRPQNPEHRISNPSDPHFADWARPPGQVESGGVAAR